MDLQSDSTKGKTHSKRGYKTIIKPSQKKVKLHYEKIAKVIEEHKAVTQGALIAHLNPIIRGWSNYYSSVCSKEIFSELDDLVYQKLQTWAQRRHPNKSGKWVSNKYWHKEGQDNWVFSVKKEKGLMKLLDHADTPIVVHVQVKGEKSPYDGELIYWSTRLGKHPEMPSRVAELLKRQKGKCTYCDNYFREGDLMEIDHIIPKSIGGKDLYKNLQLLHRHCHDSKTATDRKRKEDSERKAEIRIVEIWNKGINGESMTVEEERLFRKMAN